MKVKSFYAEKVYGYLDFDMRFNDDVSFLVGSNGSGKTTALQIMNALVMPSFKELIQIPFGYAALEIEEGGERLIISSSLDAGEVVLRVTGVSDEIRLPVGSRVIDYPFGK